MITRLLGLAVGRSRCFAWTATVLLLPCCGEALAQKPNARGDAAEPRGSIFTALTFPGTATTHRVSSSAADLDANGDARTIGPGETLVLAELSGPGAITHFWNTVASADPFSGRSLVLHIYWDGAERPGVEVPLGDFFGVGHGATATFSSLPVSVSSYGRARSCYWRMPFRKSAKVTLTNERTDYGPVSFYYYLDWEQLPDLPEDALYFHARYRQGMPAEKGDHVLLETTGRGHYVGTVYSVQQVKTGWFGEGDDRFFIDGETTPSIRGTGTEDYFGDAWGFRPFAAPFHGVTLYEGVFPGDRVSAYRWHLNDPIRFTKSLKVSIEHRGSTYNGLIATSTSGQRPDWVSSVAFWYQTPPTTWKETLPPAEKRLAPYRVLMAKDLEYRAEPRGLISKQKTGLVYMPRKADAKIEFDFDVAQKGRYQISAMLVKSLFGGRYQPQLDGQAFGAELDLNERGFDWTWFGLDLHELEPGKHTLSFVGRGLSPGQRTSAPRMYGIGVHSIILLRMEDMRGYQ